MQSFGLVLIVFGLSGFGIITLMLNQYPIIHTDITLAVIALGYILSGVVLLAGGVFYGFGTLIAAIEKQAKQA